MNIKILNQSKIAISHELFENIFSLFIQKEDFDPKYVLDLLICGDTKMAQCNKRYTGIAKSTDILSFSLDKLNGSIIINLELVQKSRQKQTLQRALSSVFIHGLCHLLGFDHFTKVQKKEMNKKEKKYLEKICG